MGDFNHSDIFLKDNTAGHKQSRFMQCTNDKFLAKVIKEPIRKGALLDLMCTNEEEMVKSSLGCSDHEMVELRILKRGSKAKARPQPWISGLTLISSEICLEVSTGYREKRVPEELVDIQGSLPPS